MTESFGMEVWCVSLNLLSQSVPGELGDVFVDEACTRSGASITFSCSNEEFLKLRVLLHERGQCFFSEAMNFWECSESSVENDEEGVDAFFPECLSVLLGQRQRVLS